MPVTTNLYQDPTTQEWMGPRRHQTRRLFNYLGLKDPGERRGFKLAARQGALSDFFGGRPTSADLFNTILTAQNPYDKGRKARRFKRLKETASQFGWVGQFNPANIPGVDTGTETDRPPNTPPPPGGPPGAGAAPTMPQTIEDMLRTLGGYVGPVGQQASNFISNRLGGGLDLPSFENMFKNLLDIHNREGAKNIAALNEAYGSRGARYGSDILQGQADMRRQQTQDLAAQADQLALQLGQQQQGMIGQQLQAAQLEQAARENAMQRMFQEYLMQSQLPPIFQSMIGALSGLPQGDTISYVQGGR